MRYFNLEICERFVKWAPGPSMAGMSRKKTSDSDKDNNIFTMKIIIIYSLGS